VSMFSVPSSSSGPQRPHADAFGWSGCRGRSEKEGREGEGIFVLLSMDLWRLGLRNQVMYFVNEDGSGVV
jgi:hypothetical protein